MDTSQLTFYYGWRQPVLLTLDGQEKQIDCIFNAFEDENVTKEQQQSFDLFVTNQIQYEKQVVNLITKFINDNKINQPAIHLTALQFNRDGSFALLCDCSWDIDNGIAIVLYPEAKVIVQDEFL